MMMKMSWLHWYKSKVVVEFFLVEAMKTYRGFRGIVSLILNIGTKWRWLFNFKTSLPQVYLIFHISS
jgi:hypothetical protein